MDEQDAQGLLQEPLSPGSVNMSATTPSENDSSVGMEMDSIPDSQSRLSFSSAITSGDSPLGRGSMSNASFTGEKDMKEILLMLDDTQHSSFFKQDPQPTKTQYRKARALSITQTASPFVSLMGFIIGIAVLAPETKIQKWIDANHGDRFAFYIAIAVPTGVAMALCTAAIIRQEFFLDTVHTATKFMKHGYLPEFPRNQNWAHVFFATMVVLTAIWVTLVTVGIFGIFDSVGHLVVLVSLTINCVLTFWNQTRDKFYDSLMSVRRFIGLCQKPREEPSCCESVCSKNPEQLEITTIDVEKAAKRMQYLRPIGMDISVSGGVFYRKKHGNAKVCSLACIAVLVASCGVGFAAYSSLELTDSIWDDQIIPCTKVCLEYAAPTRPHNPPQCHDCLVKCVAELKLQNEMKFCTEHFKVHWGTNKNDIACSKSNATLFCHNGTHYT